MVIIATLISFSETISTLISTLGVIFPATPRIRLVKSSMPSGVSTSCKPTMSPLFFIPRKILPPFKVENAAISFPNSCALSGYLESVS